ncbi:unnamed protein product [Closterium sp. NIES-64]|nr:unnamed protein product [Closterium sp. NIES-64]
MAVSAELVTGVALWLLLNLLVPLLVKCAELSLRSSPLHWRWLRGGGRRGSLKRKRRARGGECDSKGGENTRSECANKGVGVGLDSNVEEDGGESGGRRGGADGEEMRGSKGEAGGNDGRAQGEREQEEVTLTSGVTSSMGYIQIHTTCFNPWLERLRMLPAKSPAKSLHRLPIGLPGACNSTSYVLLWDGLVASLLFPLLRYLSTSSQHLQENQGIHTVDLTHNHSHYSHAHYSHNPFSVNSSFGHSSAAVDLSGTASALVNHAEMQASQVAETASHATAKQATTTAPAATPSSLHVLQPVLPGVNMPLADLSYLFIATLISLAWHEAGHAVAAAVEGVRVQHVACFLLGGGASAARGMLPPRSAAPRSTRRVPPLLQFNVWLAFPFSPPPLPRSRIQRGSASAARGMLPPRSAAPRSTRRVPPLLQFNVWLAFPFSPPPLPRSRIQRGSASAARGMLPPRSAAPRSTRGLPSRGLPRPAPFRLLRILSAGIWHNMVVSAGIWHNMVVSAGIWHNMVVSAGIWHIQALLFFRSTPSPPPGLKVTSVHPLSPLFSHIRPGDSLLVLDHTPLSSPADYTHLLSHLSHVSHLSYPLPSSIPPSPPFRGYCISLSANHKLPPGFLTPPAFPANGIRLHGPSPSSSPSAAPSAVSALPLLTLLLLDLFLLFQFLSFLLHFLHSLLSSISAPLWGPVVVTHVALFVFHVSNALALINAAPIFFLDGEAILSDFLRLVLPFPSHPLSSHPLSSHHLHLRHQQQIIRHHRILTSVLYGGSFLFFVSLASSILFSHT